MNWRTQEILERVKDEVSDPGVFSDDQIARLQALVNGFAEALARESACIASRINHSR